MYLHIGGDIIVKKCDIVGIFELDGKITTEGTKDLLTRYQKQGLLESAGSDLPKSYIIVKDNDTNKIYLSHISVSSLVNRCSLPF